MTSPVNPDLIRERSRATFDVERMTHLLDGGAAQTARRRYLESIIQRDPTGVFDNSENIYLHRTERHIRAVAKHVRLVEIARKLGIGQKYGGEIILDPDWYTLLNSIADDIPLALHWVMFVPNILSLCDEEQQKEWLPLCRDWRMIGCYAQTELGHGSNVRALETTATFQSEAKGGMKGGSWIIHSPTLTSTKFWPGTLGRNANHAMVIARLIDGDGNDRGVHNFLVPLRSMKDHTLLKGVTTGDIGPKIGYNVMDNGFCHFDHVVIPRRNMAMRFAVVDEDGKYQSKQVSAAASKIAYITMMQVRAYIVNEANKNLAMAATIAIRYAAVRRQGYASDNDRDDNTELAILEYKTQQHRLFSMLACSYCFFFTGRRLLERLFTMERLLVNDQQAVTKVQVADIHASSSCLKSFTTMITADGMEDLRKACGGSGFLQASGLPELVTTYLQSPTVEGDNHMLPQQVVKVLLKLVQAVHDENGVEAYQSCDSYDLVPSLRTIRGGQTIPVILGKEQDVYDLPKLLAAFRHRAARILLHVAMQLQNDVESMSIEQAWNRSLLQMARASHSYAQFLLLRNFLQGIDQAKDVVGLTEVTVLQDMARLFAVYWIEREMGEFLEDSVCLKNPQWIRTAVLSQLDVIHPNAVALVDARDFSDFRLKSTLGRFDGFVYEGIMEAARRDPLNRREVTPAYPHLKKLIVDGVGVHTGTASRI